MYYDEPLKDVYLRLNTTENGLVESEAKDRLIKDGPNSIKSSKKVNPIVIFLNQFKNFLIILLIFAALISLFLKEYPDFFGIISIVMLSAVLGFIQEYRAEKAMEALRKISAPYAKVIREGKEMSILAANIVAGDIIVLEDGDIIPADLRIISASSLQVDESSLTGESLPVKKTEGIIANSARITEQENMLFMGTIVTYGKGKAIVTSTGMHTEFGKIADSIQSIQSTDTPLQVKFEYMAKQLSIATFGLVFLVFVLGYFSLKIPIIKLFMFSLSLAVAAVPSALPAIVTISLGLGAKRLADKNMIVKQLPAAESLGAVTIICTDKTGTLTKNQMTITKIYTNNQIIDVTGAGYAPDGNFSHNEKTLTEKETADIRILFNTGYLCNNSKLVTTDGKWAVIGDSTEGSLIVLAKKAIKDEKYYDENFSQIEELPFDSDRKLMSVICENYTNDKTESYIKGAPDVILQKCDRIIINGKIRQLTKKDRDDILRQNNEFAESALRVLGLAYKDVSRIKKYDITSIECELIFIGLVGMLDPPREGVAEAITQCKESGIKVVMITGDHPVTAKAIARSIGLLNDGDLVLTGTELEHMTDAQLEKEIDNVRIIARALPIQKTRIVDILQKKGHIVAMTGDGVNDAPALKKADVGIAMGISGTDVSKEVAKAILVDDHFATIVNAILEGRNIYDKIIKSTKYLLACNTGEIVSVFFSIMMGLPLPMIPLQLLMMNLLTDGLPALGLGSEEAEDDVMKRPPRDPTEKPISNKMLGLIIFFGIAMGIGTLFVFNMYARTNLNYGQTMAFTTLVMFEMFAVMSARSFSSFKKMLPFSNKTLSFGILASIVIQLCVIYVPFLQTVFHTVPIRGADWLIILGVSIFGFILMEVSKIFIREEYKGVKKKVEQVATSSQ